MAQQPQLQTGTQFGQQQHSTQHGGMQGMGQQMGRLPAQQREAVMDVAQAIAVCGWCADQCIQEASPGMTECIRLCEDVVELGETLLALAPRNSRYTQSIVQAFQQAADACAQECGRHQHGHCQDCAQTLPQAANSAQQLLQSPAQQGM